MSYSFTSALGSTPEERLKAVEGFNTNYVRHTQEEAKAFIKEFWASGRDLIIHRVDENDVLTFNHTARGDKELTAAQIADLKSRYDFTNLTPDAYKALLAELNMMGVLKYGQSKPLMEILGDGGAITLDDISSYVEYQIVGAKHFLELLYAAPNPSLQGIDDFERSIAALKKIGRIMGELFPKQANESHA